MKKIKSLIYSSNIYYHVIDYLKSTYLTKDNVSIYKIIEIFKRQLAKDNIVERAQAMAFNFTLSIFPAIIFLFTLIPYVPIPNVQRNIMYFLSQIMPTSMFNAAASTINDIISIPRGGLLSFGFLTTVFTISNGIMAMMNAFNKCYKSKDRRGILLRLGIAIFLVIVLSFVIIFSISFTLLVRMYVDQFEASIDFSHPAIYYIIIPLKYIVLSIVFFLTISTIYYIAPAVEVRWKFFSLGSIIATILCILFNYIFSFYINSFEMYNKVYGSIGAIIGLMIWFFIISLILILGFEINASIDLGRGRGHLEKRV